MIKKKDNEKSFTTVWGINAQSNNALQLTVII